MKIIGFTGAMGSGKSTALDILDEYLDQTGSTKLVKFAAPLYDIQEFIYSRISSVYRRKPDFIKDRLLLQFIGTNWGRDTISETLWVDIWKKEVTDVHKSCVIPICDDVRFDNEAEALKALGGTLIKIVSDKTDVRINTKAGIANHASESGISDKYVDYTVVNDQSLNQYKQGLCGLYRKLRAERKL